MKSRIVVAAALSVVLALCLALVVNDSAVAQSDGDPAKVGRYQGTAGPDCVYLIDTETGECWNSRPKARGWQRMMNPVQKK